MNENVRQRWTPHITDFHEEHWCRFHLCQYLFKYTDGRLMADTPWQKRGNTIQMTCKTRAGTDAYMSAVQADISAD